MQNERIIDLKEIYSFNIFFFISDQKKKRLERNVVKISGVKRGKEQPSACLPLKPA